jgi:hypothetical protein
LYPELSDLLACYNLRSVLEVLIMASLRWIVVALATLSAPPVMAEKVGFLDTERAVTSVQEGKRQLQALDD